MNNIQLIYNETIKSYDLLSVQNWFDWPNSFFFGIAFFYLRIFVFVMKAKSRTMSHAVNKKISNKFNASIKVAKGLFCSYFLFTICWYINLNYLKVVYLYFSFNLKGSICFDCNVRF